MAAHLPSQRPNTEAGLLSTLASAISISGGASVGQYGPLVHFGGVIGDYISKLTRDQSSPHILLACGAASAISSGFGAPIAGMASVIAGYPPPMVGGRKRSKKKSRKNKKVRYSKKLQRSLRNKKRSANKNRKR